MMRRLKSSLSHLVSDHSWHEGLKWVEKFTAKILSIGLVIVIFMALFDLSRVLIQEIVILRVSVLGKSLFNLFGLFLNVLIALELLENFTAYLRHHVVQLQLVIITALTAVARKIIIYDAKVDGDVTGLAIAVLSLSISYWIVHQSREH